MTKVNLPLFSESASGSIGKTLTFGSNQAGEWVRGFFKKATTRNESQSALRDFFKDTIDYYKDMSEEERMLWGLVLQNQKLYNQQEVKQTARTWRCHLSHWTLSTRSFTWDGSPFAPELIKWLAPVVVPDIEELKADIQYITGLSFNDSFDFYFFPYLGVCSSIGHPGFGEEVAGFTTSRGVAVALKKDYFEKISLFEQRVLVSHEMTHVLMAQHGWKYRPAVYDSEIMADEVGERTAKAELTPIYTYKGKTLTEWIESQK